MAFLAAGAAPVTARTLPHPTPPQEMLFAPLADCWPSLDSGQLPNAEDWNRLLADHTPLQTGNGLPLRFAAPVADGLGYEERIFRHGVVEHRSDNWHDFFNAVIWRAFPLAKAAISLRHAQEIERNRAHYPTRRGAVRDALTQWDECGLAVASAAPELSEQLRRHEWKTVFWQQRAQIQSQMRFFIFGHATLDHLRAPYFGLCAKAVYFDVTPDWLTQPLPTQRAQLDHRLASWLAQSLHSPRDLRPLPLLGIPGVVAENAHPNYYDDPRQFRPAHAERR